MTRMDFLQDPTWRKQKKINQVVIGTKLKEQEIDGLYVHKTSPIQRVGAWVVCSIVFVLLEWMVPVE